MSDLELLFKAEARVDRWRAEYNYASSQLDLSTTRRNMKHLISQYEPLNSIDIDRDKLRVVFSYVEHGNITRLKTEIWNLENGKRKESENLATTNNTQEG